MPQSNHQFSLSEVYRNGRSFHKPCYGRLFLRAGLVRRTDPAYLILCPEQGLVILFIQYPVGPAPGIGMVPKAGMVPFGGRLAGYRYYDMHQIVGSALHKVKEHFCRHDPEGSLPD